MTGVYIAGPMRGYPGYNFAAFEAADKAVRSNRYLFEPVVASWALPLDVFNPALADVNRYHLEDLATAEGWAAAGQWLLDNPTEFDLRAALAEDMEFIARKADHIVLLPGWEGSAGVKAEKALSEALGHGIWWWDPETGLIAPEDRQGATLEVTLTAGPRQGKAKLVQGADGKFTNPEPVQLDGDWPVLDILKHGLGGETVSGEEYVRAGEGPAYWPGEVRTTSSTGGEKGVKPEQYQSIPTGPLRELAEHYAKGAAKYGDHNFRKGYEWSKSYSALLRHLLAFWGGEDLDPETGSKHVTAVAWHALTLSSFMDEHPEFDDRCPNGVVDVDQAEVNRLLGTEGGEPYGNLPYTIIYEQD